jgi:6-pyruvoyltetrahydropterin/6-carboxytetrahydropterin synthase
MMISREIQIDAGHRLQRHGGMCRGLHGHRYRIVCTVFAEEGSGAEQDMAMDFGTLKAIMMKQIHDMCDHALILECTDPLVETLFGYAGEAASVLPPTTMGARFAAGQADHGTRYYLMEHAPTAERLAEQWGKLVDAEVRALTDGRAEVVRMEVWETPNCCATWTPELDDGDTFEADQEFVVPGPAA